MTFSGLPSLRDPKQSHKNSASSASPTSTSSSAASSPTKSPQSDQQYAVSNAPDNINPPSSPTSMPGVNANAEPMVSTLIEKSCEELVQASIGSASSFNMDMSSSPSSPTIIQTESRQQQQIQLPTPPVLSAMATAATKKKSPQSLSPIHSAAYRKRLNVNQVCDWCRYRKIRCDRESPCNSCQHSKRECIRTPPSVLLNNMKSNSATDDAEPSSPGKTKRSRADNKDGRFPRASKSYRGSSISSYHSSSYTSHSSDENDNDADDEDGSVASGVRAGESSVSPAVNSLTLAGLGLGLDTSQRGNELQLGSLPLSFSTGVLSPGNSMSGQASLQDQEHLERMRRIEMLLSSVIPGAAEFIAQGTTSSQLHQQKQKQQQQSSLASSSAGLLLLQKEGESSEQHQQQVFGPASDHIERMKRIELLLGTLQDQPLAMALMSQSRGGSSQGTSADVSDSNIKSQKKLSKELKKQNKREAKKVSSNGQMVKRPHVAAGFAGQKPPPKLPQAIAEAAQKKQGVRKKRASTVTARATTANTNATSTSSSVTENTGKVSAHPTADVSMPSSRDKMASLSPSASFEILQDIDSQSKTGRMQGQHQALVMPQPAQQHLQMASRGETASYQQQQQRTTSAIHPFQQYHQFSSSSFGSMAIPLSNSMPSYGSLVVPASSSPSSSASSSPRTSRAETVSIDGSVQDNMSISAASIDTAGSVDNMTFPGSHSHLQNHGTHLQLSYSQAAAQLSGSLQLGFDFSSSEAALQQSRDPQVHPFSDHTVNQQQQAVHISQSGFDDLGLDMSESLESLMKKNMGSYEGLVNFADQAAAAQILNPPLFNGSPVAQCGFFQQQQQQQQQAQQRFQGLDSIATQQNQTQLAFQDVSRSMWIPSHSGSFTVPADPQFSWPHQGRQQPHQSSQSINISVGDSPQPEMELDLDLEDHGTTATDEQQRQLNAHALFQQQHQQQMQQMRKNSLVAQHHSLQQHRASIQIQHQHQQTFYIPQMQDDDDEDQMQTMYDNNRSNHGSNSNETTSSNPSASFDA